MLIKLFMKLNILLIKASGGRLGSRMGRGAIHILRTVGRRTKKPRETPIVVFRDGEDYLVVASNWGRETSPAWYYNLQSQPAAQIQAGKQLIPVKAREALDAEYDRLWGLVTSQNSLYLRYQEKITRLIPIMILEPVEA